MDGDKSVMANFAPNTYALNIKAINGTVVKTPNKVRYDYGEVVTLQAVPNPGYTFASWASDASGIANPITITINSNKTVTAKFAATVATAGAMDDSPVLATDEASPGDEEWTTGDAVLIASSASHRLDL